MIGAAELLVDTGVFHDSYLLDFVVGSWVSWVAGGRKSLTVRSDVSVVIISRRRNTITVCL